MKSEKHCSGTRMEKSLSVIHSILEDLPKYYTQVGGEISEIRLMTSHSYRISIPQEERIDQITYTFEVDDKCNVKITNRELTASTPWQK